MPYRRLPNTDQARLRAMEKALKKCLTDNSTECPIQEATLASLEIILPKFQHALINLAAARKNQVSKNKEFVELFKKAKIYVSHFIQVMNLAIARGELKTEAREFYQLAQWGESLPPLISEKNLLEWGKKIIEGEQKRLQKGGNPIYNPSIALVKVNYEKFADFYLFQKNLGIISNRASKLVNDIRPEVDALILQVWNEIEDHFMIPEIETTDRDKTSQYGIVYVFRKHEKLRKNSVPDQPLLVKKDETKKIIELKEELLPFYFVPKNPAVQSVINF